MIIITVSYLQYIATVFSIAEVEGTINMLAFEQ